MHFRCPPTMLNERGEERRVGVEVEFAGIGVEDAVDIVQRLYGGTVVAKNRFECVVESTCFGDFRVEVDSKVVTDRKVSNVFGRLFGERAQDVVDDAVESIAKTWVPCEIVTPPIPMSRLPEMEKLRLALHEKHALGTRASLLYGFAFQLNPEVPRADATSLRRHLQAFLALYEWLLEMSQVDFTRRIGPFITPFPEAYRQKVLSPDYRPDLDALIADYVEASPTRNRPLDLLPVFSTLRPDQVRDAVGPKMKINPRPTYHYRLPNCLVDEPAWSFGVEWNRWCEVERLAADPRRLEAIARSLCKSPPKGELARRAWVAEVARQLP